MHEANQNTSKNSNNRNKSITAATKKATSVIHVYSNAFTNQSMKTEAEWSSVTCFNGVFVRVLATVVL